MKSTNRRMTIPTAAVLLGAVLSGGLLFVGCGDSTPPELRGRTLVTAEAVPIEATIRELGVVESRRITQLNAPFRGRIVYIAETGTQVSAGDVVIRLDVRNVTDQLEQRLEDLKAVQNDLNNAVEQLVMAVRSNSLDISAANAQLDLARVELESVNRNLADLEELRSREIVSGDEVTRAVFSLSSSQIRTLDRDMQLRAQVTGSQTTRTEREIQMERLGLRGSRIIDRINEANQRLQSAEIVAPTDGVFLRHSRWDWRQRRMAERVVGDEVSFDDILGRIPDTSDLYIRSQIPETDMLRVQLGAEVTLDFESLGNLTLPGVITQISPVATERETSAGGSVTATGAELTGERVFEISIDLMETSPRLRPGLTARARIVTDRREDVLMIPTSAVTTRGRIHTVTVWNPEKRRAEPREIQIGQVYDNRVEVVDGLNRGEQIIL